MMFELAARNGVDAAVSTTSTRCGRPTRSPTCRPSSTSTTRAPACCRPTQDFYDLMPAYLRRAHADGVRHAEIFFDPQTHTERGIGFDVFMTGLPRGDRAGARELGISAGADHVLPAPPLRRRRVRHAGSGAAVSRVTSSASASTASEVGHPPEKFAASSRAGRGAGLRAVAHAGEEGPPAYIERRARRARGRAHRPRRALPKSDDALVERLAAERRAR